MKSMKYHHYYVLIANATFILGIFIYTYMQGFIIFRSPFYNHTLSEPQLSVVKKKVMLFYWQHESWHHEEIDLLWSENVAQTIEYLINSWLTLLDEEKVMNKKVTVQSVAITPNGHEALFSLDRNPFDKASSTYEKWLWVEALLKTLRQNDIKLQAVQLLIHHQPMVDYHIDFSNPWPLEGFLS